MRLAYVIPYYAPAWAYGGPPRVTHDMARHMVQRGHRVDVLTTDAFDAKRRLKLRDVVLDGVHVHRDRNISNRAAWEYKVFVPAGFRRTLRQHLPESDVVHLFDFRSVQNAIVLQEIRHMRRRPPYVISAFGELPRATGVKRPMKQVYDVLFGFRLLRHAAYVLAQTPEEAQEYRNFGCPPGQIRELPLAVSLEELDHAPAPGTFRQRWGVSCSQPVVLFLGRIHEYKGIDVLLNAFAEVAERRPDARLVIAGRDDGYLSQARAIAASRLAPGSVLFPGPIYGADRFAAYRDADVFAITPTHAEQTSLAALEACAVGTPVLLTEQAPIPGLDAAGAGLTVPADPNLVARALTALLDRADRREMGGRAAALVAERHSWDTVARMLEAIYTEVAR